MLYLNMSDKVNKKLEHAMHMIVDHGDEFTVYIFSRMRVPLFYGSYFLWSLFELTFIPYWLRKKGKCTIIRDQKHWVRNYPWLWGASMTFDKRTCGTVSVNGRRIYGPPLTPEQKARQRARRRRILRSEMW